jgi:hypothetical protein
MTQTINRQRTDRDVNATTAAQLIGFDMVYYFDDLPAGFRFHWEQLEQAGAFRETKTIGDLVRVYCDHLAGRTEQQEAA